MAGISNKSLSSAWIQGCLQSKTTHALSHSPLWQVPAFYKSCTTCTTTRTCLLQRSATSFELFVRRLVTQACLVYVYFGFVCLKKKIQPRQWQRVSDSSVTRALNLDFHLEKFDFNLRKSSLDLRYLLADIEGAACSWVFLQCYQNTNHHKLKYFCISMQTTSQKTRTEQLLIFTGNIFPRQKGTILLCFPCLLLTDLQHNSSFLDGNHPKWQIWLWTDEMLQFSCFHSFSESNSTSLLTKQ